MGEGRSFKDLEVWRFCRDLRVEVWGLCKGFPQEERFRLSDQMIRASRSVTANIAEGHGRFNYQENIRFCRMARGSLSEVSDHLSVASECGYVSEEVYRQIEELVLSCVRLLNGYIGFLKRVKEEE